MIRFTRAVAAVASAGLAATALAACGSASTASVASTFSDLEKGANGEKEVLVYSAAPTPVNDALVSAFNKSYPDIKVNVTQLPSGTLLTRFASEATSGAPGADLTIMTDSSMYTQNPDWFVPLTSERVPNVEDLDSTYVGSDFVSVIGSPYVSVYNTKMVATPPKTWDDLLKPEYMDQMTFQDPAVAPDSLLSLFSILGDTYGPDYLKTIGKDVKTFFSDSATGAQNVASGQAGLSAPNGAAHAAPLIAAGAPVKTVTLSPVVANTFRVAVAAKGSHPNAAVVFANFLASADGQSAWCSADDTAISLIDETAPGCQAPTADMKLADPAAAHDKADEIRAAFGTTK